jgi:hypothetical protein
VKKLFFLLLTVALCVTSGYAQTQPNIYASGLQASAADANGDVQFTYTLNANASQVKITVDNGDEFTITTASDLTKGLHTVTQRLTDAAVGDYDWSVQATGASASPGSPVKISTDEPRFLFWGPRGIAVDNHFNSPFFGRIYASEGSGGTVTAGTPNPTRTTTTGVYILNTLLEDVTNQGATAYAGGVTWGATTTAHSLDRVFVAPDGKVYLADVGASPNVYILDPASPSSNFTPVFSGNSVKSTHVILYNGFLYVFDVSSGGNINKYDISTIPATPTATVIYNDISNGNLQQNLSHNAICPDGRGGWWISQHRAGSSSNGAIPCLIHYNTTTGTVDYNSGTTFQSTYQGGMAYLNTGSEELLALGTTQGTIKIWSVTYDTNGHPALTDKWSVSTGTGAYARAIDFDKAMNLYAIDNNTERLRVFALPKTANTFTTPAPTAQKVVVTTAILPPPQKTFTVTVPNGTERVYIAGDFTDKSWDITNPYQLQPTANPNEFSGKFPCVDGVEYKYFCETGDRDYIEGVAGAPGQPADSLATNRTIATGDATTDVIPYWYNVKKIHFEVSFDAAVPVKNRLSVRVWPNAGTASGDAALTRSGNSYTGSYGGNAGDKFRTNTTYKYFIPVSTDVLEDHVGRIATTPAMTNDVIMGFVWAGLSGTHYIPASGVQQGWSSLHEAFDDINALGITGDLTLLITADMTETQNVGLINTTDYSITIRPDADENRTITFSDPVDTDPSGAICIGVAGIGVTKTWENTVSSKNITIDGYAQGDSTRRLAIRTTATQDKWNSPIAIINGCSDIQIKNCILEHAPAANTSGIYTVWVRAGNNYTGKFPSNILIENNDIINNSASNTNTRGIGFTKDAAVTAPTAANVSTGIIIKDNTITSKSHALYIGYMDGVDIIGNEIHITGAPSGGITYGIYPAGGVVGTVKVQRNKFVELKSNNSTAGDYGIKGMTTGNTGSTWYIENNYFTGFDKTLSGGTQITLVAIRSALSAVYIRHNTFYLNALSYAPTGNSATPASNAPMYAGIDIAAGTPTIENNLFVSEYDAAQNFFIRGDATANNNVFTIANDNAQAQISTGIITGTNVTIPEVEFTNAAAGNLDLTGASDGDGNLAVPFLSAIPKDIHGSDRNTPLTYAGAFEGDLFDTNMPKKTFTVIAPEGTEHVYIAGTFTTKTWNIVKPYELTPTGNPNEFSGRFPCEDGVEYLYLCEKGDWDYVEGIMPEDSPAAEARTEYRTIVSGDETFDEIPYWFRVRKIVFEVTFAEGVTVPLQLYSHITDHENTSFYFELTLTDNNTFVGVLGDYDGSKYGTASAYNYFVPLTNQIWEDGDVRYITAPKKTDVITGYVSGTIAGEYYIPNTGEQRGWNTLRDAFEDINIAGISGDVTLLIAADIESPVNVGLTNNTDYSITIRPDADEDRTITFNQTFDNVGPWGSLCLGIRNSIRWKDVAPAQHITIDGYAEGGSTRRLKITTAATHYAGNFPILILDKSTDITIKNCIVEHIGRPTNSSTYGIYLRTNPNPMVIGNSSARWMPQNVCIENNEIINTTGAASQGIGVYADAVPMASASGIVVKDNIIRARTRGIFVNDSKGMEITGNEFHINQTSGGLLSSAIFANTRVEGTFYVTQNKFVELKTANTNAGDYGIKAIITGGEKSVWYIENNYFTGFDKTASTVSTSMLQAIRLGTLAGSYIRHNTFHLNALTNKPTNTGTGAAAPTYSAINIAAGTPVIQNNLFVSDEDACANYFIRGDAPEATGNNVFCLQAGTTKARMATGTVPADLKTVDSVVFEDAAAGILDLTGASINDWDLGVTPLEEVPADIYGTPRSTTLAYAGAFEGEAFTTLPNPIKAVNTGDIRIVQEGNRWIITVLSGNRMQAVKLYDLQGRTMDSKQGLSNTEYSIAVPGKGVYLVEVQVDGARTIQKIAVHSFYQ